LRKTPPSVLRKPKALPLVGRVGRGRGIGAS
jgi:hypothetical protein